MQNHVCNSVRLSHTDTHTLTFRGLQQSGPHSLLQSLSPKLPESTFRATPAAGISPQLPQGEQSRSISAGELNRADVNQSTGSWMGMKYIRVSLLGFGHHT